MLKMAVLALGLSLSMAAQAEMKLHAECRSNIRSKSQSDTESALAPVNALTGDKTVRIGTIAGKTFSLSLIKAGWIDPVPDLIQLTAKDGLSEVTSKSSVPGEGEVAPIAISIKSLATGEIVSVSCDVTVIP